ncbi:MAG: type II toxin-antitoxin system RelE/ParE family toxin [Actinomycetes bacterium]|jgi:mRNA-degrading endonuclease RelE of RelBE toxin-antitoxin system
MKLLYSSNFSKNLKKLNKNLFDELQLNLKKIINEPNIGSLKKGDLSNLRVLKFKFNNLQYLICYEVIDDENIKVIYFGVHENFYQNLKNYLKN